MHIAVYFENDIATLEPLSEMTFLSQDAACLLLLLGKKDLSVKKNEVKDLFTYEIDKIG